MGTPTDGHRQRLRARFKARERDALSDEALLELLLCYAIPQRDVQPLAKRLIEKHGSLSAVLSRDVAALCSEEGIKEATAVLLKLVDQIRTAAPRSAETAAVDLPATGAAQGILFAQHPLLGVDRPHTPAPQQPTHSRLKTQSKTRGVEVFSKTLLKETAEFLPILPETNDLGAVRDFVRSRLHYSSETTRDRRSNYLLKRMFPAGTPDQALLSFARLYAGQQELRDVVFHRFCDAEPLMGKSLEEFFLPAIGAGAVTREALRAYLKSLFPESKTLDDCGQAIAEALVTTGIGRSDRRIVQFAYRDIALPSFAFVLHSVFPEPAMYSLHLIECHPAIRRLLWNPERLLPSIYELRNRGLISKVSEIDSVRQFTTKYDLPGIVNALKEAQSRK